jgi:predicted ATPase
VHFTSNLSLHHQDDLQWADTASLNLISALVNSESNSYGCCSGNNGLMIVGACRGNEVALEHELSVTLRDMEEDGVCITDIGLSNLDMAAIHEMASTVLSIPSDRTTRLATFLYQQSGGNALFVRQLLIALGDDGYFELDPDTQQHAWEDDNLNDQLGRVGDSGHYDGRGSRRLDHESAVRLVTKRIRQQLSPRIQRVLMLASCLGAEFEEYTLEAVEQESVRRLLLAAEQRDLITRVVVADAHKWRFVHDQIQQACYGLIPEECRERTHLDIGRALCQSLTQDELEFHLNTIIDQLRRGADLIQSQDDRNEVALLCLKAGEMATKASAFQTAADHLHLGIRLLGQRNWRDQYYLSLDIYMAAAEVEYCWYVLLLACIEP